MKTLNLFGWFCVVAGLFVVLASLGEEGVWALIVAVLCFVGAVKIAIR